MKKPARTTSFVPRLVDEIREARGARRRRLMRLLSFRKLVDTLRSTTYRLLMEHYSWSITDRASVCCKCVLQVRLRAARDAGERAPVWIEHVARVLAEGIAAANAARLTRQRTAARRSRRGRKRPRKTDL